MVQSYFMLLAASYFLTRARCHILNHAGKLFSNVVQSYSMLISTFFLTCSVCLLNLHMTERNYNVLHFMSTKSYDLDMSFPKKPAHVFYFTYFKDIPLYLPQYLSNAAIYLAGKLCSHSK